MKNEIIKGYSSCNYVIVVEIKIKGTAHCENVPIFQYSTLLHQVLFPLSRFLSITIEEHVDRLLALLAVYNLFHGVFQSMLF